MRVIAAADVAPVPWKNGGGVTRELLRVEDGQGGDWRLRISVADIGTDGPFSPFPGITRWFAVLEGTGVRLAWPDRVMDIRPGDDVVRFDGGDAPGCELLSGPTRDLNVMLRDGTGQASVTPVRLDEQARLGHATALGVFTTRPLRLCDERGGRSALPALSLAWLEAADTAPRTWWLEDAADTPRNGEHTGPLPAAGWWIRLGPPASA